MINADKNRFIKQHLELYGEELFLDSITKKSKSYLTSHLKLTF